MKIMVLVNEYTPEALARRKAVIERSVSKGVEVGYAVIEGSGGGKAVTNLHRTLVAPAAAREVISLPMSAFLSEADQDEVIRQVRRFFGK